MKVLCFGSANIDDTYSVPHMVQRGETLAATQVVRRSGGKGLNQAIALARGGADTYFAGAVGSDGAFLIDELEAAGVNTSNVARLEDERTGNAIIQIDATNDNCIILYGGANRCITKEQITSVLAQFEAGDLVVLQNEINLLDAIIDAAYERGMAIALNPSPMEESLLKLPLEKVSYLLVNEVEALQLLGASGQDVCGDWGSVAAQLSQKYPACKIVLTLGGEGSMFISGGKATHYPAQPTKVVDTTAAGDTFTGFLLSALMRGVSEGEAMQLATKAASIAVSRPGAAPSIPTLAEVEA